MRPKKWVFFTLCLLVLATILQIGGLVSPMWIWLQEDDYIVGVGLFYRVGCGASDGGVCTDLSFPTADVPFGYTEADTYDEDDWVAVVWLETISACFALLLCIMLIVYAIGFGVWKKMGTLNIAMVVACILSWMPLLAGLIVYLVFHGRVVTRSPEISSRSFPWSVLMCFFAAILLIIITILIRYRCRQNNYVKNAIPTSADSKMALNPSTKNQLMKRYFTPSPYREDRRQALYSSAYDGSGDQNQLIGSSPTRRAMGYSSGNGYGNGSLMAIEYLTPRSERRDVVSQDFSSRYIGSQNLTSGGTTTTVDNTDNNFRGTIFEKDLGTSVRENTYGNTRVIERKYIRRTEGAGGYGGQVDRDYIDSQPQEVTRTYEASQRQWGDTVQSQAVDPHTQETIQTRVVGHKSFLNRNQHDGFSEAEADNTDAETIYYTGREGLSDVDVTRRDTTYSRDSTSNALASGFVEKTVVTRDIITQQPPPPPPPLPAVKEQVVTEVTVIEGANNQGSQKPRPTHYRLGATQDVTGGIQQPSDYTVHTRTKKTSQETDEVILTPGQLSGDKFKYNGTYIYRPYSEEAY